MKLVFEARIIVVLIVLGLSLCRVPLANAQKPEELGRIRSMLQASPWPPCKAFGESVTDDEWLLLRTKMRDGFTVAHMPTVDALKVEFVQNPEQLAPVLVPAGFGEQGGTLRIPRQFLQNVCKIMRFNIAAQASSEAIRNTIVERFGKCREFPAHATSCVLKAMSASEFAELPLNTSRETEIPGIFAYSFTIRIATLQTASYILAHEVGHAVIRSKNSPSQLMKIDEEFEADLLAQLAMIGDEIVPFGPLAFLSAQAMIEGGSPPQAGLHLPAACRSRQAEQVLLPMLRKVAALRVSRSAKNGALDFKSADGLATGMGTIKPLPISWQNTSCNTAIPDRAGAVMSDVNKLEGVVRSISGSSVASKDVARQFENLKMVTLEGRRLALASELNLTTSSPDNLNLMRQIEQTSPTNPIDESLRVQLFDLIERGTKLMGREKIETYRPRDLALLKQLSAFWRFLSKPEGTAIIKASKELIRNFESSFVYQEPETAINAMAVALKLMPELRSSPDAVLESVVQFVPWMTAHITLGDCRQYSYLFRLTPASPAAEVNCKRLRQQTIRNLETRMGWVWDGQPFD